MSLGATGFEPNGENDFFMGGARKAVVSGIPVAADVSSRPLAAKGKFSSVSLGTISNGPPVGAEYNESLFAATGLAPPNGEKLLGGEAETSEPKDAGSGDANAGSVSGIL